MRPHLSSTPTSAPSQSREKSRPLSHPQAHHNHGEKDRNQSAAHHHHHHHQNHNHSSGAGGAPGTPLKPSPAARVSIKVWVTKARGLPFPSVGNPLLYFRLKIENIHGGPTSELMQQGAKGGENGASGGGMGSVGAAAGARLAALTGSLQPVSASVTTQPKAVVFPQQTGTGMPYGECLVDEWVSLSTFDREGFITLECWYVGDDAFTKDDFVGVAMIPIASLGPQVLSGWFPFGDSRTEVPFPQCKGETWLEIVSDQDTQAWDRMSKQFSQFVRPYALPIAIPPSPLTGPATSPSGLVTFNLPSVGEKVEMVFDNVMLSTSGLMISRRLYLTSFRLVFVDLAFKPSGEKETSFSKIHRKLMRPTFVLLSSVPSSFFLFFHFFPFLLSFFYFILSLPFCIDHLL